MEDEEEEDRNDAAAVNVNIVLGYATLSLQK